MSKYLDLVREFTDSCDNRFCVGVAFARFTLSYCLMRHTAMYIQ